MAWKGAPERKKDRGDSFLSPRSATRSRLVRDQWSRRESNPRPRIDPSTPLRVYFALLYFSPVHRLANRPSRASRTISHRSAARRHRSASPILATPHNPPRAGLIGRRVHNVSYAARASSELAPIGFAVYLRGDGTSTRSADFTKHVEARSAPGTLKYRQFPCQRQSFWP